MLGFKLAGPPIGRVRHRTGLLDRFQSSIIPQQEKVSLPREERHRSHLVDNVPYNVSFVVGALFVVEQSIGLQKLVQGCVISCIIRRTTYCTVL